MKQCGPINVEKLFDHRPEGNISQVDRTRFAKLHQAARVFVEELAEAAGDCREGEHAIARLEESVRWAETAISRHPKSDA